MLIIYKIKLKTYYYMYFHLTTLVNVDRQSIFIYLNNQEADHMCTRKTQIRHNLRYFVSIFKFVDELFKMIHGSWIEKRW